MKFSFPLCVVILLCVVALTSAAASEISHASTNKRKTVEKQENVANTTVVRVSSHKDGNKYELVENKEFIVDDMKVPKGIIHRRVRPNRSSALSLKQHFIFTSTTGLIYGLSLLLVLPLALIP
ncbi:hypothetical protein A4A49_23477 [Nicotiana attenuata]|uniref:Uncharacterized protein n=1 Tax=Nicotiana attenuata TaxID=49451 RepID=A0A314KXN5_NICAT|nr:hypothetical protein A4A49_23477 [Nicotiana attenuata]